MLNLNFLTLPVLTSFLFYFINYTYNSLNLKPFLMKLESLCSILRNCNMKLLNDIFLFTFLFIFSA